MCQWKRVPQPKTETDPIPVKGGVLRYVVHNGQRRDRELLIDIAYSPFVLEGCLKEPELRGMLVSLSLDFVDEVLSVVTDRKVSNLSQKCCGDPRDIAHSLDEEWNSLLSEKSRLDVGDSVLRTLKSHERQTHKSEW